MNLDIPFSTHSGICRNDIVFDKCLKNLGRKRGILVSKLFAITCTWSCPLLIVDDFSKFEVNFFTNN